MLLFTHIHIIIVMVTKVILPVSLLIIGLFLQWMEMYSCIIPCTSKFRKLQYKNFSTANVKVGTAVAISLLLYQWHFSVICHAITLLS